MADETDAEKIARLEQECEELTEQIHFMGGAMKVAAEALNKMIEAVGKQNCG